MLPEQPLSPLIAPRVLTFRCAKTAKKFMVLYSRDNPVHQFRIHAVLPQEEVRVAERSEPAKKAEPVASPPLEREENSPSQTSANVARSFNALEFDHSGWYCPWCNYARFEEAKFTFIKCGTCGELVCGGGIIEIPNGPATFKCHDGCTGGGRLKSDGSGISSYDGISFATRQLEASKDSSKLLQIPGPTILLLEGPQGSQEESAIQRLCQKCRNPLASQDEACRSCGQPVSEARNDSKRPGDEWTTSYKLKRKLNGG